MAGLFVSTKGPLTAAARTLGAHGGKQTARNHTPRERTASARRAANARWHKGLFAVKRNFLGSSCPRGGMFVVGEDGIASPVYCGSPREA